MHVSKNPHIGYLMLKIYLSFYNMCDMMDDSTLLHLLSISALHLNLTCSKLILTLLMAVVTPPMPVHRCIRKEKMKKKEE